MYPRNLKYIRKKEFSRFKDQVYLDFTGASLYSEKQVKEFSKCLQTNLYGNPHSGNPSSDRMKNVVEEVRNIILSHFHVTKNDYDVIFTSGTTASLKLLAQAFNWKSGKSCFAYLEDNHTSVVGMRQVANENGAFVFCLQIPRDTEHVNEINKYDSSIVEKGCGSADGKTFGESTVSNLLAYPAQSNFTGRRYPLNWINEIHQNGLSLAKGTQDSEPFFGRWFVLLDAAAFVPTSPLNLAEYPADFVCMSFYKMFGFPTGIGALLVNKHASNVLNKKQYFGGGTTDVYTASESFVALKAQLHERFEEGTIGYLDILALKFGFHTLQRIAGSMENVSKHVFSLIKRMLDSMQTMSHRNGKRVCEIYALSRYKNQNEQGAIISFNLLKDDGSYIGFISVLESAAAEGIHLRGGCFCNYGSCNRLLEIGDEKLKEMYKLGYKCGKIDLVDDKPVGALRVSLGYMSTMHDVKIFITFLREKFVNR